MNKWLAARNLLVVRPDNIGDVIMLGPALRAIKETSPQAHLTLLTSPSGSSAAPLLPWIDEVLVQRPVWQDVGGKIPFDPEREQALIQQLAARRFDAALIFTSFSQTPHVPGYVCYLAGIPLRAGESKEFGGSTLTDELKGAPDDLHQVERNLRLVEQLGFTVHERNLAVELKREARQAIPALLQSHGIEPSQPFLIVHPGASAEARRYPTDKFGKVAAQLRKRGLQVLVTGVERERELIEAMLEVAPETPVLTEGISLTEFAALIERASLVICNDTLPMHLADTVGTPEVVLFSGTDREEQWRPRTVPARLLRRPTPCHPCYLFSCPIGLPCLDIPPAEVVEVAVQMLLNTSSSRKGVA
jgi:ADP-heptose:LPS heptosyltransferase